MQARNDCNSKRLRKGTYENIVTEVKKKRNLPISFDVCPKTIRQRIARESTLVLHRGTASPLKDLEPSIVSTIIQICRICQSLTATEGLSLVNSMIKGTKAQEH